MAVTLERKPDSPDTTLSLRVLNESADAYRARLLAEAGLGTARPGHFKRPGERPFTRAQREHVTILIGGLTRRHEQLIKAAMEGLGYKVGLVPTPKRADFQAGKEYGNNGQCNPTYFTVGALVNYLKKLRDEVGMPAERILDDYVFMTAGACGPCRFGMYEAEYRLALRNSGFDGFRVLLFQQQKGMDQSEGEAGIEFNVEFFLGVLNAMFMGDLLNEVAFHVRPYELTPGSADETFAKCVSICERTFRQTSGSSRKAGKIAALLSKLVPVSNPADARKFIDQLIGKSYTAALTECARIINDQIEVDYTRPKPVAKITGEFWAQTTEGDGNFKMFSFLEGEGAEVLVEPIATWIAYLVNQTRNQARDRRGIADSGEISGRAGLSQRWTLHAKHLRSMMLFSLAQRVLLREYERMRRALGGTAHELVNQNDLVRLGHPFYNSRSGGGEGHLEVAKNIYYCNKELAHMVLSLKPFGCMPSTQSDGAQAAVVSRYADMIYLPIETSGEGEINAHSRVQMALGEAKVKCKDEFNRAVARTGYTIEEIREYVARHRELRRPLQQFPSNPGVIGRAANFVLHVGRLMDRDRSRGKINGSLTVKAELATA